MFCYLRRKYDAVKLRILRSSGTWHGDASLEPELRMLPALRGNGCFIDVGANVGSWSRGAAAIFPHVYAFEPDQTLSAALCNRMPFNVSVYSVALSDREGFGDLAVPLLNGEELKTRASLEREANPGFSEAVRRVKLATLDSYQFSRVSVIKIDVEGHEGSVVDGASKTIQRERPVLIVEIEERHHPDLSRAIFDKILCHGYLCCYIDANSINVFEFSMLARLQPKGVVPPIGTKPEGYVNNFIFLPYERKDVASTIAKVLWISDTTGFA